MSPFPELPSLLSPASKGFSTSFGLFQNGFRPIASPAQTYDEDLAEIILADQLGFRGVWISEQHGEPIYINKVDTLPFPELLMCRAASVTKNILHEAIHGAGRAESARIAAYSRRGLSHA